jgi:hypothetical protein
MTISSAGMISWKPEKKDIGTHNITICLSDGKNITEIQFAIDVKPENQNGLNNMDYMVMGMLLLIISMCIICGIIFHFRRKLKRS